MDTFKSRIIYRNKLLFNTKPFREKRHFNQERSSEQRTKYLQLSNVYASVKSQSKLTKSCRLFKFKYQLANLVYKLELGVPN